MTIFVDFHGTISNSTYWSAAPAPMRDFIQHELFEGEFSLVERWMRGEFSAEDVCNIIAQKGRFRASEVQLYLRLSCTKFRIYPHILAQIGVIRRAKRKVVLITSNMDCFELVRRSLRLDRHFDLIVNSADYGMLKDDNDGYLFDLVLGELGERARNSVLVDDSEKICNLFKARGGLSHRALDSQSVILSLKSPDQLGFPFGEANEWNYE